MKKLLSILIILLSSCSHQLYYNKKIKEVKDFPHKEVTMVCVGMFLGWSTVAYLKK